MRSRTLSQLAILGFVLAGIMAISLRHSSRVSAREALEDSIWKLTYDVAFKCQSDEAVVRLALPTSSRHVTVEDEQFTERPAGILAGRTRRLTPSKTREFVATARELGEHRVSADLLLRLHSDRSAGYRELENLSADARARYTRDEPNRIPIHLSSVKQLLQSADGQWEVEEERLQWIFDYCSTELNRADAESGNDSVLSTLSEKNTAKKTTPLGRVRTMVALCRAAGIPARTVAGFELRQEVSAKPRVWLEVFRGNHWAPFDPENGYARSLPNNFVPVRRGGEKIVMPGRAGEAIDIQPLFSVVRIGPPAAALRHSASNVSQVFDLTRLPVEMHEVLTLLLLLPFGALVVAVFRNVVGVQTFGTFAPTLFALSFVYADWVSGVLVLAVVLGAGFAGRLLIERLRLLMVPRLSIIMTTIILCVVLGVSALDFLQLTPSAKAVLLPLVIVTILIERFYLNIEEDGPGNAMRLLLGTIVVSVFCFLVFSWGAVGRFILVYPEAHLLTIAAFVVIGRYTGYRLSELVRFRDLLSDEPRRP